MNTYCVSGFTTYSSSGTSMSWETDEEKIKRVRKKKRGLRNKKLERIYGRVQEEANSRYLENSNG